MIECFQWIWRRGFKSGYYMYQNCPIKCLKLNSWWYFNIILIHFLIKIPSTHITPPLFQSSCVTRKYLFYIHLHIIIIYSHVRAKRLLLKFDPLNSVSKRRRKKSETNGKNSIYFQFDFGLHIEIYWIGWVKRLNSPNR